MNENGCKTLMGLKSILQYLDISRPTFVKFIELGLPARVINGRWYAHVDNLDEFFKRLTRYHQTKIPKDAD